MFTPTNVCVGSGSEYNWALDLMAALRKRVQYGLNPETFSVLKPRGV